MSWRLALLSSTGVAEAAGSPDDGSVPPPG